MNSKSGQHDQEHLDFVSLYAVRALPSSEIPAAEAQISGCAHCRQEVETLRPVLSAFISWPTDVLRPPISLWGRLADRIAEESGGQPLPPPSQSPTRLDWEEAAAGIAVQFIATDGQNNRVTMLVRLAPGAEYPPHRHAGPEELYLLQGELIIDDKKLYPGDYIRAEAGSVDHRVWSETGCTCLLLTSTKDEILL